MAEFARTWSRSLRNRPFSPEIGRHRTKFDRCCPKSANITASTCWAQALASETLNRGASPRRRFGAFALTPWGDPPSGPRLRGAFKCTGESDLVSPPGDDRGGFASEGGVRERGGVQVLSEGGAPVGIWEKVKSSRNGVSSSGLWPSRLQGVKRRVVTGSGRKWITVDRSGGQDMGASGESALGALYKSAKGSQVAGSKSGANVVRTSCL